MKKTALLLSTILALALVCKTEPVEADPTPAVPIVADTANWEVRICAKLNRKWCDDSAAVHNCCVYLNGTRADRALFQAYCHPVDFFDALIAVGADSGVDMGNIPDSAAIPTGSKLDLTIRWDGSPKTYALSELVEDSLGRGFEIRMHNSRARAIATNTGCIYCHTSCPISVTSNTKYNYWENTRRVSRFKGRGDLLPANGTDLVMTFKLVQ